MAYEMILTALADPTRRAIFEKLRDGPQSVSELASGGGVSRPAVSQHLKVLSDAGLVEARAKGTARIYSALPENLSELRDYIDNFWGDVLSAFATEVRKQEREND